jgi:ABC-type Zn2+ transport system substrate-binding protein/surface adhesin
MQAKRHSGGHEAQIHQYLNNSTAPSSSHDHMHAYRLCMHIWDENEITRNVGCAGAATQACGMFLLLSRKI